MNIFRFIGDMLHLASIIILIMKIRKSRNCIGLSCKTQEIYLLVFCLRYMDLFMYFVSLYNSFMKIAFIGATAYIVYLMRARKPFCTTYDKSGDDFPHFKYLVPAAAALTLIIHTEFTVWEMIWSFSLWLEAFAIFPQLVMLQKLKDLENITGHYIVCLGAYRVFYILNWVYRYFAENYFCLVSVLSGIVQTGLYADFFYYYYVSMKEGKTFTIPF